VSVRLKLMVAFLALSAAALGAALYGAQLAVEDAAREKMQADLVSAVDAFKNQVGTLQRDLQLSVQASFTEKELLLTYGPANASQDDLLGLGSGGAAEEGVGAAHALLKSADLPLLKGYRSTRRERDVNDLLVFVNADGVLLYTDADRERLGVSLKSVPLVARALAPGGGPATDLWSGKQIRALEKDAVPLLITPDEDDLFVVHAAPLVRAERRLGAVLVGRRVKPALLPRLEEVAHASVVLRSRDGVVVGRVPDAAQVEERAWGGAPVPATLGDTEYLAMARDLQLEGGREVVGKAMLLRQIDADVRPILGHFTRELPKVALAALALAVALALVLSTRLVRPLVRLEEAARKVKLGDLSVEVPVETRDEVGRLTASFNEMVGGLRQRDQIKGLFKRYLDPQVVEELIRHPERATPGGNRRELSVLFCDLAGFTGLSERMEPEDLVAVLNEYFEKASQVLAANGATFDKFIGDAIMCFWNAPLPQEDHAARACRTALGLLKVVDQFDNVEELSLSTRLKCRVGINTGSCVVGNIGSRAAQDYTVVGDAVNLASRLEGTAKVYGTRTLISEATMQAAGRAVVTRELDLLRVRGRAQAVRVYELLGVEGTLPPPWAGRFAEGLGLYRERRFEAALRAFEASPEDPASRVFAERCRAFLAVPPPEGWDGVYEVHG
jgi:class 3 adenylate cyclase